MLSKIHTPEPSLPAFSQWWDPGGRGGGLQADKTLLFGLCLGGADGRLLGREEPLHGWSRGRVGGAAAAPLAGGGLLPGVVDEAVGPGLEAALHLHGQLSGVQRSVDTIHEHTEDVGVCGEVGGATQRGDGRGESF